MRVQLDAVLGDIGANGIKTGMLSSAAVCLQKVCCVKGIENDKDLEKFSSWTRFFADIGANVAKPGMLPQRRGDHSRSLRLTPNIKRLKPTRAGKTTAVRGSWGHRRQRRSSRLASVSTTWSYNLVVHWSGCTQGPSFNTAFSLRHYCAITTPQAVQVLAEQLKAMADMFSGRPLLLVGSVVVAMCICFSTDLTCLPFLYR